MATDARTFKIDVDYSIGESVQFDISVQYGGKEVAKQSHDLVTVEDAVAQYGSRDPAGLGRAVLPNLGKALTALGSNAADEIYEDIGLDLMAALREANHELDNPEYAD